MAIMEINHRISCVDDIRHQIAGVIPKNAYDYYQSGADEESTLIQNENAFKRLTLLPRILRDVSNVDVSTTIQGTMSLQSPICIAPTAAHKMAHSDGELATIQGAKRKHNLMTLSTYSNVSMEEAKKMAGDSVPLWFQIYVYQNRRTSEDLIRRAEKEGYKALVITVDTPYLGNRRCDIRNKYGLPPHLRSANFPESLNILTATERHALNQSTTHTLTSSSVRLPNAPSSNVDNALNISDASLNWERDIQWARKVTTMPIILKGILSKEDAEKAVEMGVDGIVVSNHGGRQLDTTPATIEALPEVCTACKGTNVEVYLDGGIRHGSDIFKALALGAKAVFIGRPILWGLAYHGSEGVSKVLEILDSELRHTMALAGVTRIEDITKDYIVPSVYYQRGYHLNSPRVLAASSKL